MTNTELDAPQADAPDKVRPRGSGLSLEMSLLLDVIRFGAALLVMISHLADPQIGGSWLHIPFLGFFAVMLFFVLSGFVIGFVADEKEKDPGVFAASRLARLWSALIPALALTAILDAVGRSIDLAAYGGWGHYMGWDHPVLRLLASAFFVNELWFFSASPLSNAPAWSLGFEAWYYVIFGMAVFTRGWKRPLLTGLAALAAGPKILLLMPPWLFGWAAWKAVRRGPLRPGLAWTLMLVSLALFAVLFALNTGWAIQDGQRALIGTVWTARLKYAEDFIWAWIIGALVAASFVGMAGVAPALRGLLLPLKAPIRGAADLTLSIYLTHMPVLLLASTLLRETPIGPTRTLISAAAAVAVAWVFNIVFERRKGAWKAALTAICDRLSPRRGAPAPREQD